PVPVPGSSTGAPGEPAAALAILAITELILSAYGRAASAAVCARRSLDAATICMALVIFCVALVEAMRTRMSFSEAILSSPRRSDLRSDRKPLFHQARRPSRAMMANQATDILSTALGVTLDHRLQLGR